MIKRYVKYVLWITSLSSLVGCETSPPAPVSNLGGNYSNTARGEYRGSYYTVKKGDTLYFISYLTDKNVNDLIAYNNLSAPYTIYPGQRLNLWRPTYQAPQYGQRVKPTQTNVADVKVLPPQTAKKPVSTLGSSSVAKASVPPVVVGKVVPATPILTERSVNNSKNDQAVSITKNISDPVKKDPVKSVEPSQSKGYGEAVSKKNVNTNIIDTNTTQDQKIEQWLWPTKGRVISNFSSGDQGNKGIDIAGQRGQAIVATANGSVVYSGNALRGYGNLVIIKHNDNYLSAYAHNDRLLVKEGQNVIAGEKIATMGSTGASSVRLHFEIRYQGKSMNPSRYLP
jgi:lipoprotein NlpD